MTDTSLLAVLAEQAILVIAAVAALRTRMADVSEDVRDLKLQHSRLPEQFVPRLELEQTMRRIEGSIAHTSAMVQALLYAGGDRKLALEGIQAAAATRPWMEYSERGFAYTKQFEGLRLEAYRDGAGTWTIGFGHTGRDVFEARKVTEEEAELLLRSDLAAAVAFVNHAVLSPLNQNQFDALVDFCFNVGAHAFGASKLLALVNEGNYPGATVQFGLWIHAGGVVVPGLAARRAAEAKLFAEPA